MIFHPIPGDIVRVHYNKKISQTMPCQGLVGVVVAAGRGPGPANALLKVDLWPKSDYCFYEVIPRGNLLYYGDRGGES